MQFWLANANELLQKPSAFFGIETTRMTLINYAGSLLEGNSENFSFQGL